MINEQNPVVETQPTQSLPSDNSQIVENVSHESQTEKMVPQSKVNEIIKEKLAVERDRATKAIEAAKSQPQQQTSAPAYDESQIRNIIKQEAAAMTRQNIVDRHKFELSNKLTAAMENPEIKASFEKLPAGILSEHNVELFNSVDNIGEVLHHLVTNEPLKITEIYSSSLLMPEMAKKALKQVSESIKVNKEAQKTKLPSAPLSQVSPSITGTDNGKLSVRDFKKIYKA